MTIDNEKATPQKGLSFIMRDEVNEVRIDAGRLMVGLAALLLGVMVVVQFRLQQIVPPPTQTQQLLTLLKKSDQRRQQLQQEISHLRVLLNQKLSAVSAAKRLSSELTQAEILAGTVPVKGPGIQVVWANGSAPTGFQIGDIDLLLMVNELRASGAEAISINGQRITAETEIRSAANYVLINNSQQNAPYTIDAIGPSSTMMQALEMPGGLVDQSNSEGRTISVTAKHHLVLPAASAPTLQYTQTSSGSGSSGG